MASISVPATVAPLEHSRPFHLANPSMSSHSRRKSRDPGAAPLPSFSFSPGAASQVDRIEIENQEPEIEAMSSGGHTRRISKASALPEFSFNPGAALPKEDRLSPTHPVLEEMALNQQRISRSARPAPLPAFTFAPGTSAHTSPSPTRSEFAESAILKPAGGHKRAGSEFVGGGGVDGLTMVNTSPIKHERQDSRPTGPPVSGAGRRGHAHRRSQAVSISDIDTSDLIKAHAVAKARSGSQPSTPSEIPPNFASHPSPTARQSVTAVSPPSSPRRREATPGHRPSVQFAERIDVIPRPLSMISSETEGSTSTVRYGHSLNSSINSIASPIRIPSMLSSPMLEEGFVLQRPKTADPATMLFARDVVPDRSLSAPNLPKRPLSASGSPAMTSIENPPVKKKHFWFTHSPDRTPTPTPTIERPDPFASMAVFANMPSTDKSRPKTSPERSMSAAKRKKYQTWTHGIFSKRTKSRSLKMKPKRSPTPPTLQRRASDLVNDIFDTDNTVVICSGSPETKRQQPKIEIPTPASVSYNPLEVTSPIIDLDAALGPFGSDEKFGGEHSYKGPASRIAKLHSSERRGIVDAFGTVHRRTESAPSMPAFNRSSYATTRHGSNPSLIEEVLDEEEEDDFNADEKNVDSDGQDVPIVMGAAHAPKELPASDAQSVGGLGLTHVSKISDAVLILDQEEDAASSELEPSKSNTGAPMFSECDFAKHPMSSPMSFAYPSTQSHYASSTEGRTTTSASMISSPDPDQIQFDTMPRLGHGFGEPSSDLYLRPSTDNVSLNDSISSTTARPKLASSERSFCSNDPRDQRSASMFVPGTSKSDENWKRSSLATLNKLMHGSANGSKLKFETMPDCVPDDRPERRSKRFSKFLTFFRAKDRVEN